MIVRFLSAAVSAALVAGVAAACSSLPDIHFDSSEAGVAAGDGGVPVLCACEAAADGWVPVNFAATSRPSCPAGEAAIDVRVASGDGTPTCACTCTGVGGTCGTGNVTVSVTGEATCGIAPATTTVASAEGSCTPLGAPVTVPATAFAKAIRPPPTSCVGTPRLASPLTDGRVCEPPPSSNCGAGQACKPATTRGLTSCVAKAGMNACPGDFPKRSTVGTGADESKACVGCACAAPTPCTGGTVSLYDSSSCKTNGSFHGAVDISTGCAATSDTGFSATHFRSTPATGGCAAAPTTQPTPGTLAFTNARTVCCK